MKLYRAYRNLHKNCFSVQSYVESKNGYRVTDRGNLMVLESCEFKVYESGRQKVLDEKRKNFHAYILFENYSKIDVQDNCFLREVYYNPYMFDSFVYKDTEEKVLKLDRVLLKNNKVYSVQSCDIGF